MNPNLNPSSNPHPNPNGRQVLLNEQAGHLLRAKLADVDEGGVCAGFAVLSSPVLFP